LILGDLASPNGFNFGGTLNVGNSSVTLRDSNHAILSGTANLAEARSPLPTACSWQAPAA